MLITMEVPGGPVVSTGHFTAWAQVQSLVWELKSHKPLSPKKKKKKMLITIGSDLTVKH